MKILFYINVLCSGGAERVVTNLANQFSQSGCSVGVVTTFKSQGEYVLDDNVERFVIEQEAKKGVLMRNISRIKGLRRIVKSFAPDVLVSFMAEPNFRAILATRGLKVKTILSVRNDPEKEYQGKLSRFLAKLLFKKADGIVFQTPDAQAWFPKKIQEKSTIIANQVNPVFFEQSFNGERRDVVTVGRLTQQKNQKLLIDAFSQICDKFEDNLIIYGDGELLGELSNYVKELKLDGRVVFAGNKADIQQHIAGAKLFVLSSDYEGMPNALMEAMALGLCCISTDCPCGGPRMLFDGERAGRLFSVGSVDELKKAMLEALSDIEARESLQKSAKERARDFLPERIFELWKSYVFTTAKK